MKGKGTKRAAGYIRMSSDKQERSPAEQKADLEKLATKEGYGVTTWYSDEAIHGDSGTDERPGLAAMIRDAERGEFSTILCWHTNRLSRQDEWDSVEVLNRLRKAEVGLHTCCEGQIDLQDFSRRLLLFIGQRKNKQDLLDLAQGVLRAKIDNAKKGARNGGPPPHGLERVLVDSQGKVIRALKSGEIVKQKGCVVMLRPGSDKAKLAAVRYAFDRYAHASLSIRKLASELQAKGYAPPRKRWTWKAVRGILSCPAYVGNSRWGAINQGRYFRAVGDGVEPVKGPNGRNGNGKRIWRRKDPSEAITVEGVGKGIIDPDTFAKVQRKLAKAEKGWRCRPKPYPLSGLLWCEHCGQALHGHTCKGKDRSGKVAYTYPKYRCQTYDLEGKDNASGCGHQTVDADRVLRWVVGALQREFLGAGREEVLQGVKADLSAQAGTTGDDRGRLETRLAELDKEVSRLVGAIRRTDVPGLIQELREAHKERQDVQEALQQAGRFTDPGDIDQEAERIADSLVALGARLAKADPSELRELLALVIQKITCKWKRVKLANGRTRCPFEKGEVLLRDFGQVAGCFYGSATCVTSQRPR